MMTKQYRSCTQCQMICVKRGNESVYDDFKAGTTGETSRHVHVNVSHFTQEDVLGLFLSYCSYLFIGIGARFTKKNTCKANNVQYTHRDPQFCPKLHRVRVEMRTNMS